MIAPPGILTSMVGDDLGRRSEQAESRIANGRAGVGMLDADSNIMADTIAPLAAPGLDESTRRPFMFVTPVWGESFVAGFISVTLPSLLSEGNLGAFGPAEVEYAIVTTAEDEEAIRASASFRQLERIAVVSFIRHHVLKGETSYERL